VKGMLTRTGFLFLFFISNLVIHKIYKPGCYILFMDQKGNIAISGIAIAALLFLIVMVVYAQVQGQMNLLTFSAGVRNLIALMPLVVVASAIVGIIIIGFKLSQ